MFGDKYMSLRMQRGYFLFSESFVWTKEGLKKITELREQDEILGINFYETNYEWRKIINEPVKHSQGSCVHVFTDQNEAFIPVQNVVSTIDAGRKEADNVEVGNVIEIFHDKNALLDVFLGNKKSEISPEMAYLFGILSKRIDFHDEKMLAIKVEEVTFLPEYAAILQEILQRALDKLGIEEKVRIKTEAGPFPNLNWIIIESLYIRKLLHNKRLKHETPYEIRCSTPEIIKEYIAGVFDASAVLLEDGRIDLITSVEQHEIRRFIYYTLTFFGVFPMNTYLSPSWCPQKTIIRFDSASLMLLKFKNPALKTDIGKQRKQFINPRVRHISNMKGLICLLAEPKLNWSPIADAIYVHSRV
jgi:hypothetical protein